MSEHFPPLGKIVGPERFNERDAHHLPTIVVRAGEAISRAMPITISAEGIAMGDRTRESDIIVDPFLDTYYVEKDEHFVACLKPGSIKTLRHVWSHQTIPDEEAVAANIVSSLDEKDRMEAALRANPYDTATRKVLADWYDEHGMTMEARVHRSWTEEQQDKICKLESDNWLHAFASEVGVTYELLIYAATMYLEEGRTYGLSFETPDVTYEARADFWRHFQRVTGHTIPEDKKESTFFRCAC